MTHRMLSIFIFTALAMVATPAFANCALREIQPHNSRVDIASTSLNLEGADDANHPTAWLGPIILKLKDGTTCQIDKKVSIITTPLWASGNNLLYVSTYSGSNRKLYAIALTDCSIQWQSTSYTNANATTAAFDLHEAGRFLLNKNTCLPTKVAQ
jgi:hypothetical protein